MIDTQKPYNNYNKTVKPKQQTVLQALTPQIINCFVIKFTFF